MTVHACCRTYLDPNGKKKVELPDKIRNKLHEKERPKTAVMKEIQHTLHTKIDEQFKAYIMVRQLLLVKSCSIV